MFKLAPDGTETVIYSFLGGDDGTQPYSDLLADAAGNLYGATHYGGSGDCDCGVVFKLAPNGSESVLHSFAGGTDGAFPSGVIADAANNLYGATAFGGGAGGRACSAGCGTMFKLAPDGTETILTAFAAKNKDGYRPAGIPISDKKGLLYDAAALGGAHNAGTVFEYRGQSRNSQDLL